MKTWDTKRTLYRVSDFVSWQRAGLLNLSPSFQRRPVWKPSAKSFLVDTIVKGLPIPIIILREKRTLLNSLEPIREVVDGQQRIRTVMSYIDHGLLKDYKSSIDDFSILTNHNKELAGKLFKGLDDKYKSRILDYEFSVHILPADTDDKEVLQIFARMNATGVKLNPQELRNAEWFGKFKTSIYILATEQLNRWRSWRIFTEYNIARMDEVELTSEFALFIIKGLTGKSQSAINSIYRDKDEHYAERAEVERRFRIIMDTIYDSFGDDLESLAFRKKTLFYHLFAIVYDIQFGTASKLKKKAPKQVTSNIVRTLKKFAEDVDSLKAPEDVLSSLARRTTNIKSRVIVNNHLKKIIKNA